MSTNAAQIFGLYPQKGVILPGSDADLLIYDPEPEVVIRAEDQHTIGGYTPYEGMTVQGRVRTVLSRGDVLVEDGDVARRSGAGAVPARQAVRAAAALKIGDDSLIIAWYAIEFIETCFRIVKGFNSACFRAL